MKATVLFFARLAPLELGCDMNSYPDAHGDRLDCSGARPQALRNFAFREQNICGFAKERSHHEGSQTP
jgi:hypothetical protein